MWLVLGFGPTPGRHLVRAPHQATSADGRRADPESKIAG